VQQHQTRHKSPGPKKRTRSSSFNFCSYIYPLCPTWFFSLFILFFFLPSQQDRNTPKSHHATNKRKFSINARTIQVFLIKDSEHFTTNQRSGGGKIKLVYHLFLYIHRPEQEQGEKAQREHAKHTGKTKKAHTESTKQKKNN